MPCCATVWTGRPSPAEKRGYSLVRLKNATIPSSRPAFQRRPCADWLKHGRQATARSAARSVLEPGEHGCIIEAGYDRTRTKRIRQLLRTSSVQTKKELLTQLRPGGLAGRAGIKCVALGRLVAVTSHLIPWYR